MKKLILIFLLVFVSVVNATAPVASFTVNGKTIVGGHITVSRNETVCFTSTSTDPDGDSLKYRWTFGDGGDTSGAANPCHTYRTAGSYTIKLKVSDRRDSMPLLTGKTPSTYSLPSGWSLVRTQDFETGSINSDEYTFGSVTTTNPHSGTRSNQSIVWKDDCATGWKLNQGITTGTELYISWWEYLDRQAKLNDEMFLFYVRKNFTSPAGTFMGQRWQYLNDLGNWDYAFNLDSGEMAFFCEGSTSIYQVPNGSHCYSGYKRGHWMPIAAGQWRQWEVYYKPSTGTADNGRTIIYLNGILQYSVIDSAINKGVDMTGAAIYLGGTTYTKITWITQPDSVCTSQADPSFDASYNRPKNFKWPTWCPDQSPPNGYVPKFRRFVDDIIILQRGN